MIDYVLKHSDIVIHYITSDPKDAVFSMNEPKLKPYYIGEMKLITLMMKMDADMVIMTSRIWRPITSSAAWCGRTLNTSTPTTASAPIT